MAAEYFQFTKKDKLISGKTYGLGEKIEDVKVWQIDLSYEFSFHNGHEQGHPVYVNMIGNRPSENMPKIDTMNKGKEQLNIVNKEKLIQKVREDAMRLVRENFDAFKMMALKFYGDPKTKTIIVGTICSNCRKSYIKPKVLKNKKKVCPNCGVQI